MNFRPLFFSSTIGLSLGLGLTLGLGAAGLAGCAYAKEEASLPALAQVDRNDPLDYATTEPLSGKGSQRRDFSASCSQGGGRFNEKQETCECPAGQSYSGWQGLCVSVVRTTERYLNFTGHPKGRTSILSEIPIPEGYLKDTKGIQVPSLPIRFKIKFIAVGSRFSDTHLNDEQKLELRTALNTQYPVVIPRSDADFNTRIYLLNGNKNPLSLLKVAEVRKWPFFLFVQTIGAFVSASFDEDWLTKAVNVLNSFADSEFLPTETTYRHELGCEAYCQKIQNVSLDGFYFTRTIEHVGGALATDRITLWSNSNQDEARALFVLTPSNELSHVYLFEKNDEGKEFLTVLDAKFRQISSRDDISGSFTPSQVKSIQKDMRSYDTIDLQPSLEFERQPSRRVDTQLVVCESGLTEEMMRTLGIHRFLLGPFPEQSLFGWMDPAHSATAFGARYLSGAAGFNEYSGMYCPGNLESHAREVLGQIPAKVIPIGIRECLEGQSYWLQSVYQYSRARVISLSASENYDEVTCQDSPIGRAIQSDLGRKFLWVIAAGNTGLNLEIASNNSCPATLRNRDNLIVVAAGQRIGNLSVLDSYSNYGERYVDLAANGYSLNLSHTATSFAAPRVSRIAAEIFARYPQFSPEEVKRILILSADINYMSPLPVLSGGNLNEVNALKLAEEKAQHPFLSQTALLETVFGTNRVREKDGDLRVKFFRARQFDKE